VFPLGPVQPECAGHRVEHLGAGVDLASLFQPGVPGDADASQQRHFLTPQSRRAAPGTGRHAEITRAEPGPPGLQELTELRPPSFTGSPTFTVTPVLGRPRRPFLLCSSALRFVRDQGLFPSRNLPQSNLAVTTDIPVMTPGWSS
jgi:hypothetical protein